MGKGHTAQGLSASLTTLSCVEHVITEVRVNYFEQVPYVQVLDDYGAPVLDLSCTDALNLALLLTAEAGQGLNRQLARALPQAQEVD